MWNFTCELEMSGHLKFTEYALDSKASIQCEASKLDLLPSSFTLFTAVCCTRCLVYNHNNAWWTCFLQNLN